VSAGKTCNLPRFHIMSDPKCCAAEVDAHVKRTLAAKPKLVQISTGPWCAQRRVSRFYYRPKHSSFATRCSANCRLAASGLLSVAAMCYTLRRVIVSSPFAS